MGISEILRYFLVDEEFTLGEKTFREDPKATDSSKSDDSHDQNHISEALRRLLAEKKEASNATPSADIVNVFQRLLADDHRSKEIYKKIQHKKKETPETFDHQEDSEVVKLLKGFLADKNLLVDTENDGEPNCRGKHL